MMVLIKSVDGDDAPVVTGGVPESRFFKNGFPPGIEGIVPVSLSLSPILNPVGDKTPDGNFRKQWGAVRIYK
jgi:hypothetical protein